MLRCMYTNSKELLYASQAYAMHRRLRERSHVFVDLVSIRLPKDPLATVKRQTILCRAYSQAATVIVPNVRIVAFLIPVLFH